MAIHQDSPIIPGGSFLWREYTTLRLFKALAEPSQEQAKNARELFQHLQTLIRDPIEKPLTIVSGARTIQYTRYLRSIGLPAAMNGAHNSWQAVDLAPPSGMSIQQFWQFCHQRWPGRMEKLEYTPTWVHLDTWHWGRKLRFAP